jgi:predicted transport protein
VDIRKGYIIDFTETDITCILKKDYELDLELNIMREDLTKEQDKMVRMGQIIKYDISHYEIFFKTKNGEYI